ncbi:unnamed protein product [Trifolium pratense]|uniref:Uncharacterized protein n=1 Tax=Trifolium pratense TaxID=57577 RepID=A0ACB0JB32_TRIPR|nr:unnamed protein product [Trifolium pratense]
MIKLNSSNYTLWKTLMEDLLYTKDLYDPIEGESARSKDTSDTDWKKMNRKAVAIIKQWLDLSVYPHVEAETNAHTMWNKLKELYERKNVQNKACLIRKLALLLLSSLPDNWDVLVVTLTNSAPSGKLVMSTVKESMLNEEARRKERGLIGSPTQSEALVTESRGRSQSKNFHKHDKSERRSKSKSRKEFTCFYCNREGHIRKYCRLLKRDQLRERDDDSENESDKDTSAVAHDSATDVYIICDDDDSINLASHDSTWIIDSGASYHVTPRRDFFSSYTIGDFGTVKMGNEGVCKIVGMGDVWVETSIGCKLQLKNVRHVPDIRLNLISIKTLDIEGYHTYFGGGGICKITKGSLVVAKEQSPTSLYRIPVKLCKEEVNTVEDVSTDLWHKRLGHLSQKGLSILAKKNFLPVKDFEKAEKQKSDARSYIDVVPKPPSGTLVDGGYVQVDDENVTNDHTHDHDEPVEEEPPESSVEPELRRSSRERQVSQRYPPQDYVTVTDSGETDYYQEIITDVDKEKWFEAMQEERSSLHEKNTFKTGLKYHQEMIIAALHFFEYSTSTFHFECGMMTPTLLDVAAITGLSPLGDTYDPSKNSDTIKFDFRNKSYSKYILENRKTDNEVSAEGHVAFLTLWLSQYVFCTQSLQVAKKFIPMAIQLHECQQFNFARLILGCLYESMRDACEHLKRTSDGSTFLGAGPFWLLQLWLNATFHAELDLFLPEPFYDESRAHQVEGTRLARLVPRERGLAYDVAFQQYFNAFLNLKKFKPSFAPFVDRPVGPPWFTQHFPSPPDFEEVVNNIWSVYLMPTVLSCRIGLTSGDFGLVGYFPNLVSRQFGLT